MTLLVVSEEQALVITKAIGPVEIRDPEGRVLGIFSRESTDETPEEIEELTRRMRTRAPLYTTEQVLAHLQSLEAK